MVRMNAGGFVGLHIEENDMWTDSVIYMDFEDVVNDSLRQRLDNALLAAAQRVGATTCPHATRSISISTRNGHTTAEVIQWVDDVRLDEYWSECRVPYALAGAELDELITCYTTMYMQALRNNFIHA